MYRKRYLSGGQAKLDADGDGKISANDFKLLKAKKNKKQNKKKSSMMMVAMKGKR